MSARFFRFIGLALLVVILIRIDLSAVLSIAFEARVGYLLLAMALSIPINLVNTLRWQSILGMQGLTYSLGQAFPAYLSSIYLGLVTPGRLGEFARVLYLRNDRSVSLGKAMSSVLADKLFDIYLLLLVGCLGLVILFPSTTTFSVVIASILVFCLAPLALANEQLIKSLARQIYRIAVVGKYHHRLEANFSDFQAGIKALVGVKLACPAALTIVEYLVAFTQCYLVALAIGLPVSFVYLAVFTSVATLIALIPVSISGIGTREASFIALFATQGISSEMALSYSLLFFVSFNLVSAGMGAGAWLVKPMSLSLPQAQPPEKA